jgi:hypothetical protein
VASWPYRGEVEVERDWVASGIPVAMEVGGRTATACNGWCVITSGVDTGDRQSGDPFSEEAPFTEWQLIGIYYRSQVRHCKMHITSVSSSQ